MYSNRNWLAFGLFLNKLRVEKYSMHPVPWSSALRSTIAQIPHICLWSSHLFQRPSEWPKSVVIGGYTSPMPKAGGFDDSEYRPSDSLHDFVISSGQKGDSVFAARGKKTPLIVISFGSMSIPNPAELLSLLSSVLDKVDARAVVCANWDITNVHHEDKTQGGTNNRIYLTDQSVPHAWLLRYATGGFVHHGGAGHTGAGFRAGVPMLLLPFMLDQHFWAAKVQNLGLGPPPVPFHLLTADKLTVSLRLLLDGSSSGRGNYALTCAEMAERVRNESDGADVAAKMISQQLDLPHTTGTASDESIPEVVVSPAGSDAPSSRMQCSVLTELVGPWQHKRTGLPLSGAAAACLVSESALNWDDLEVRPSVGEGYCSWDEESMVVWVKILSRVTTSISCVAGVLWLLLSCLVRLELPRLGPRGESLREFGQMSNMGHRAHIEQAEYDLEFLLGRSAWCGESPKSSKIGDGSHIVISSAIVRKWNAAVAVKHHTEFLVE